MEIKSLIIKNDDLEGSFKTSLIATLIGYGKMYELLHKQLWRKGRIVLANSTITINGRSAQPILYYNIKDGCTLPYNYDKQPDGDALGLDQLFVGQNPYAPYIGDPKDGIYHDVCQIIPKRSQRPTAKDWYVYRVKGNLELDEYNIWGDILVDNVTQPYKKFHTVHHDAVYDDDGNLVEEAYDEEVSDGWFVDITYHSDDPDNEPVPYAISDYTYTDEDTGEEITILASEATTEHVNLTVDDNHERAFDMPDFSSHGSVVEEYYVSPIIKPPHYNILYNIYNTNPIQSKVILYSDGTCIQITTPSSFYTPVDENDAEYTKDNGYITYLPFVYTDTGDLVQNRIDFVDKWGSEFELNVSENGYWYSGLVNIAVVVVSMVVAAWSGMSTLGIFMAGATTMMSMSGNKFLEIFADVLGVYMLIEDIGTKAIGKEAMAKGLSERTATRIAMESTFKEQFAHFISSAGFSNLAKIGYKAYSSFDKYTSSTEPTADNLINENSIDNEQMQVIRIDIDEDNYNNEVLKI